MEDVKWAEGAEAPENKHISMHHSGGWSALFLITEREISVVITVFGRCKKFKSEPHYSPCLLHYKGSKKGERSAGNQGSPCR